MAAAQRVFAVGIRTHLPRFAGPLHALARPSYARIAPLYSAMRAGAHAPGDSPRTFAAAAGRKLPPSLKLSDRCHKTFQTLLSSKPEASAMRITMENDWGSPTGFTFKLSFAYDEVREGEEAVVQDGVRLFVESKALFNTSSGLLGATLDMDDDLRISIVPREGRPD